MRDRLVLAVAAISLAACAGTRPDPAPAAIPAVGAGDGAVSRRPAPYPIEVPLAVRAAVERGTRTTTGEPGPRYWQQWARYRLTGTILPSEKRVRGSAEIVYFNRSPMPLPVLVLELAQNLHAPGSPRGEPAEVTGGMELARVAAAGRTLGTEGTGARYGVDGTRLLIQTSRPVAPGDSIVLEIDWSFRVPQQGASGRMGWDGDDLFFLAYWYPQMAVYDDIGGWHADYFLGTAEFYHGFASYDVTIDAPEGWLVMGTGQLENAGDVLADPVLARLRRAESSDSVVAVVGAGDPDAVTKRGTGGRLRWRFRADSVNDVAFSVTRRSRWDAARAPVGDRDGDGRPDHARVDAIYRESAPRWREAARYARHAIDFLSRYTGQPYPWPHMTAVEAGGIIGGGMEYPMMTMIGDYNARGDSALYYVIAHELAHMWIPLLAATDERRYGWMDEGSTTFAENQSRKEFFPGVDHDVPDQETYLEAVANGVPIEIMRWTDFQYPESARGIASYQKPAALLDALRAVIGEDAFNRGYRRFIARWKYKHPTPWDFFNTFEAAAGRDLDWFWRSWYFDTGALDQAITGVSSGAGETRITVEDLGQVPMPARLTITLAGGEVVRREVPVETWLTGARSAVVTLPAGAAVTRVELDAERDFPDANRANNVWPR
jgi:hypothetical protein